MLAGVKFCGGCNPRYDRGKAYETIKNKFKERVRFEYAEEGKDYDLLILLAGCTNRCTSLSAYRYHKLITMWDGDQLADVEEQIEALL